MKTYEQLKRIRICAKTHGPEAEKIIKDLVDELTNNTAPIGTTFDLVIGDEHDDGHGKYCRQTYTTRAAFGQVVEAKDKLTGLGIDFTKHCSEYEDRTVTKEFAEAIDRLGVKALEYLEEDIGTWTAQCPDSYLSLAVACLNKVDPELRIQTSMSSDGEIDLGGYGLFY